MSELRQPGEPAQTLSARPLLCGFQATRPAFLSVTLVAVLIGFACAWRSGLSFNLLNGVVTLVFALVAHAGVNVINDFHDARNGTDALNTERLFPFTGGSRFIQNGVLTETAVGRFGYLLLATVIFAGLWLVTRVGPSLICIGLAGLFLGWAYSAPPFKLASRGLGELAVAGGWWLVVVGSDFVQRGALEMAPLLAGLGYGLMVANLLYINQFPDATADARAGKMTVVARVGRRQAVRGYALIAGCAFFNLAAAVEVRVLPVAALLALGAAVPAGQAWRCLAQNAETPAALLPAIKATIAATHLYGILLAATIAFA